MHAPDVEIMATVREHALAGGYYLINWRGYRGYQPGENVVNVFVMGALVREAIEASEQLIDRGVYANVIVVTSPDLLCGELARKDNYEHLRETLEVDGSLHLRPAKQGALSTDDAVDLAGRRVPAVSVHDGEVGLLDNIGSILGVRQVSKAVVRFSKSGTPEQVYRYHELDPASIVEACGQALSETALEQVRLHNNATALIERQQGQPERNWRELWPSEVQS